MTRICIPISTAVLLLLAFGFDARAERVHFVLYNGTFISDQTRGAKQAIFATQKCTYTFTEDTVGDLDKLPSSLAQCDLLQAFGYRSKQTLQFRK